MSFNLRLGSSRIFLFSLLFILSSKMSAQSGYDKTKLNGYYQRQDYEAAIRLLQSADSMNNQSTDFCIDMGYAFYMNEQYEEAKKYFQKGFFLQPHNFEGTLYMAQIWSANSNWDSALICYNDLIRINPANYRFWQKAGTLNYQLGRYDSAFTNFQQAYSLNNRSGRIAVSLSDLLIHNKKTDAADSLLQEFMTRDSSDEDVIAKRIEICFKKSLYDTVIRWGEKLWRDSSKLSAPFVNLAYSYLNKQRYLECLQLCKWLEFANRANEPILYCEALVYSKLSLYKQSNEILDECINMSIQDNAHTYLEAKADNFENLKEFKKSTACYDTAWYIFHKPYDLYFAGRIQDKYFRNITRAKYYYRLFQKYKPVSKNSSELRVIEYVEGYLREKSRPAEKE